MLEAFWIPLIPPFFIGLLLSWAMESLLQPRPQAPWNRPLAANLTHIGVWTLAFALELALFRRPYFAVANVLAIQMLLVLVSRAKYQALQEPFVYPDFEYFTDAIKHPRLYLPFFGWKNALASGGGYGLALWAGLTFEDSVTAGAGIWLVSFADLPQESVFDATAPVVPFYMCVGTLVVSGVVLAIVASNRLRITFKADDDLKRIGMFGALWAYAQSERLPTSSLEDESPFKSPTRATLATIKASELPDLISVQSESFFDVRRAFPIVRKEILSGFDQLCSEADIYGRLKVAARGANTVRTEFAFLSGIESSRLGVHKYNPYRKLAMQGTPSLASYLKELGYRTICVHPYHGSFYRRNKVLSALGFDEFLDIESFENAERVGAYVGDTAIADMIEDLFDKRDHRPLFIHVITMENHGPLHWETVTEQDANEVLNAPMPDGCEDLVAYARHLRNADAMFSKLREVLLNSDRRGGLCIYGDHVPIMPKVYRALGDVSGVTDGLIWPQQDGLGAECKLDADSLAEEFLSRFGLLSRAPMSQINESRLKRVATPIQKFS